MALQNLPYFKSRNSDKNKSSIISFGTCQMPTLRFVVDRYLSIKRFVPEPFWYLDLEVKPPSASAKRKNVKVSWARGRVYDRMAATVILQNCIKAKEQAKVISSTQKETRNFRPFPLTTVVLQQSGAKYLKIPSKRIMQLAEKLYNSGYISYPRTETDKFDKDIDIRKLVRVQFNANEWGNYARELIDSDKFRNPREGKHDDKAHPPIHPVKYLDRKDVTSEEYSVYEFISRHFLACCSEDALGQKTSVTMKWVTELFHCSGLVVTARNYLDVYKYQTWKSSEEIPDFPLHSLVTVKKANIGEGKTSAPPRLTEAELIRLMDVNGIGTDATMAEHIQTIIDRGYVLRTNGIMNPTSLGVALIESYTGIEKDNLTKPFMRRELEEQTTRVCKGELSKEECMKNASKSYQDVFVAVKGAESRFVNHIRLSLQESVS